MPGIIGYSHDGGVQPHEHRPTDQSREKVIGLSCAGYNQEDIASYFDISVDTLVKHYRIELREKKKDKIQAVSDMAYQKALEGNPKMIELVLKNQGNWASAKAPEDVEKDKHHLTLLEKVIDKL